MHAWENYYMPSETWLFPTYNLTINLEIKYDPCQASIIEPVNWNKVWEYTITPLNGNEETVFPLPYFTNNVTRTIPDKNCGPMTYTLGTIAQKADLDNLNIYWNWKTAGTVIYEADFFTTNNQLHDEERTLDLFVYHVNYPSVTLSETVKIKFFSVCS